MNNEILDLPGIDGNQFKVTISRRWFNDPISTGMIENELTVLTSPIKKRYQWYWKVLNFITFRRFFNEYYYFTAKLERSSHE